MQNEQCRLTKRPDLLRRVRVLTGLFIAGLVVSGVTAIPIRWEVDVLSGWMGSGSTAGADELSVSAFWLERVRHALADTQETHPFLFYGTDWLAFGHIVIAIAFVGALRDPLRNRWLFDFGLMACGLVIPWALVFGALRGIPVWWRVIDCGFGVLGAIPLWLCRRWIRRMGEEMGR